MSHTKLWNKIFKRCVEINLEYDYSQESEDEIETQTQQKSGDESKSAILPKLADSYEKLFNEMKYADVTFKVEEKEFHAHKAILGSKWNLHSIKFKLISHILFRSIGCPCCHVFLQ